MSVDVIGNGNVIVIAPLIVAALVNGNDTVIMIDAVDDQGSISFISIATIELSAAPIRRVASSLTASITPTMSFPLNEAAARRGGCSPAAFLA